MEFIIVLVVAFLASVIVGGLLVRFEHLHSRLSYDATRSGPQKFHSRPTPRIGGVPMLAGLAVALPVAVGLGLLESRFAALLALCIAPAVASGLVEDLTKKIGPDIRLWASFLSALLAANYFGIAVQRIDLPGIDNLLSWYPLALAFTVVGIGGVAHAVNIIDGYNGLAGGVILMVLAAIGFVSWQVGDAALATICLGLVGATLGFLAWNYPDARLFAGDGGAYLWGVTAGVLSALLLHRHPEVSPWFPLAVLVYPVFETLFSIYRRRLKKSTAAGQPDARHLHQLVYRRLLPTRIDGSAVDPASRNAATSPFLWLLAALPIVPACLLWRDSGALFTLVAAFCLTYVWLYRSIVCGSVPRDLRRIVRAIASRLFLRLKVPCSEHDGEPATLPASSDRGREPL